MTMLRPALVGLLLVTVAGSARAEAPAAEVPPAVAEALQAALAAPESRLEVTSWRASGRPGCVPSGARVERPVTGSGRYAVRLDGGACGAFGWAAVRVFATAHVATRAIRAGEALAGATKQIERELRGSRAPAELTPGARAARTIPAGQMIDAGHLSENGPAAGTPVKVLARAGALGVTQSGRTVPCTRGRTCAVLPSGKHVEGVMQDGVLVVEVP